MTSYSCTCPAHGEKSGGNYYGGHYGMMMSYKPTIVEVAQGDSKFSLLVTALGKAELVKTLSGGKFTVLAPTDAAFRNLPKGLLDKLLRPENKALLVRVLMNHVISGRFGSAQVAGLTEVKTLDGQVLPIRKRDGSLFIDGAQVLTADVNASNGVIHVIDKVLVPADLRPARGGRSVQVIRESIVDIVSDERNKATLSTLFEAVKAAGLAGVLSGNTQLTVFAPDNDAFRKLGADTVNNLLQPENKDKLIRLLQNHVIKGAVLKTAAEDVARKRDTVKTLAGEDLPVTVRGDQLYIDKARVVIADRQARNGVVHIIDSVLLTPELKPRRGGNNMATIRPNIVRIASTTPYLQTLVKAVVAAGLQDTLSSGNWTVLAPTDAAFRKLPRGLLEKLLRPENKQTLIRILKNHVIKKAASSAAIKTLSSVKTLAMDELAISREISRDNREILFVDGAQVLKPDIRASNGIIHVINKVLIPSDLKSKAGRCTTKSILPSLKAKK